MEEGLREGWFAGVGLNGGTEINKKKGRKNMSENKETKQEVTNEQIMEYLKEIEIAQGCIANGINALFSVMSGRKKQLKLSRDEAEMIKQGQIALTCITDRMFDIS